MSGSMPRFDRRRSGVEEDISVGKVLCMTVGATSEVGQSQVRRLRRQENIERGCADMDVSMSLETC